MFLLLLFDSSWCAIWAYLCSGLLDRPEPAARWACASLFFLFLAHVAYFLGILDAR